MNVQLQDLSQRDVRRSGFTLVELLVVIAIIGVHAGGCHRLMADGAVIFSTESVDAGDPHVATLHDAELSADPASPFGLWGALGTASAGEDNGKHSD